MSVCILGIAKASLREFESLHATYLGLMGPSLAAKTSFGLRRDPRPRAACFVVEPPQSVAGSEIGPPRRPPTCAFRLFPARPASVPMRNITSMPSPWLLGKFLGCSLCGNLRALPAFYVILHRFDTDSKSLLQCFWVVREHGPPAQKRVIMQFFRVRPNSSGSGTYDGAVGGQKLGRIEERRGRTEIAELSQPRPEDIYSGALFAVTLLIINNVL